jgi:iron complex outermembrane receptor protein
MASPRALAFAFFAACVCTSPRAAGLADLSIEQLSDIVVTSVSRRAEPLGRAAASIFVISGDDIRRSGARTIPEALRLAPNLQVARSGASGYAITARGFNQSLANKLLVLIDGRTVYTPLFAGVFWEAQDVLLDDVERIEVISGPGGTLWGANAVNGVINIITKNAASTQGVLVSAAGGDDMTEAAARYGGATQRGFYRVYGKADDVDNTSRVNGQALRDGSRRYQGGFRWDWGVGSDTFTVQGDSYQDTGEQPQVLDGLNLLGRWSRSLGADSGFTVQTYYDQTTREQQVLRTLDVEGSHVLSLGSHRIVWGGGARQYHDRIENSAALALLPADKKLNTAHLFVQDEVPLSRDIALIAGMKVERNSYTDAEVLPNVRLAWRPDDRHLLWAAWSRAVRSPARFDRELFLPGRPPFLLAGGPDFESEVSKVYEIGYRGQPTARVSASVTGFYHDHEELRSVSPVGTVAQVTNNRLGRTAGIEGWATVRVLDSWRVQAGYTRLDTRLELEPGTVDLQALSNIASDPNEWWTLRSSHDIGAAVQLDLMLRHVGSIENRGVPSYTATDVNAGWRVTRNVDLTFSLYNAFDRRHIEWGPGAAELRRTFFVKLRVTGA